jgi:hypothetical protein
MEILTDVKITKVYEGKSGEGKFGTWQIYNFYIKDRKEKFSCFGSDAFTPEEGMNLKLLKYEIEPNGEYTNYKVKEAIINEGNTKISKSATPQQASQPKKLDRNSVAWGQCKYGFLQKAFVSYIRGDFLEMDLDEIENLSEQFADMCFRNLSDQHTEDNTDKSIPESTVSRHTTSNRE